MNKLVRTLILFSFFLSASSTSFGQELTGIWRGYFITEGGEQYKYEVQLGQSKKSSLTGVTYSYLDTRFYGKATFTGFYTKGSKAALVQEIKTVELKMDGGSVACIMKCRMEYVRSGNEEFLEGTYTSSYEKSDLLNGVRKGGNCGGGKVYLRKVITSDFYVEPFLRSKRPTATPMIPAPTVKKPLTKTTVNKPIVKKTAPKNNTTLTKRPPVIIPIVTDTAKKATINPVVINTKPIQKITVPAIIRERRNELTKTIDVVNTEINISLYDNGEIDDDSISVYLDGILVIANKRLSNKPINYKLKIDETSPEHTLIMVAENFGRIPPNTSLMIIQDGDKRYQVSITSTEQKNAMVRFRFGGKQ
ncbi:MAG: hypothetical protein JWR72_997 [Flavisolibacter sp.]|nr:hypothetical protein [Flavisolibacter sp.]